MRSNRSPQGPSRPPDRRRLSATSTYDSFCSALNWRIVPALRYTVPARRLCSSFILGTEGCVDSEEAERPTWRARADAQGLIDQLEKNLVVLRRDYQSSNRDRLIDELEQALATIRSELTQARPD